MRVFERLDEDSTGDVGAGFVATRDTTAESPPHRLDTKPSAIQLSEGGLLSIKLCDLTLPDSWQADEVAPSNNATLIAVADEYGIVAVARLVCVSERAA